MEAGCGILNNNNQLTFPFSILLHTLKRENHLSLPHTIHNVAFSFFTSTLIPIYPENKKLGVTHSYTAFFHNKIPNIYFGIFLKCVAALKRAFGVVVGV